ncbi:methyl-accepting chemotaxis protein [Cryptosporangium minutisporangium]|uniref:Methyl-accepting chemotaxis protein n=1 Tax=Cryptosporangium minutisporangium TaxID=113569 RepID=A0ABP6SST1_9ACTN
MRFTLRRQVAGLAVVGFVLVTTAGGIGYRGVSQLADEQAAARRAATADRAAQTVDVARASYRANVLAALVTNNPTERQEVLDRLGVNVASARAGIDDVIRYTPEVRPQADAALARFDELIASGQRMVTLASRVASDPSRRAALAARPAYEQVDTQVSTALDTLEAAIGERVKQSSDQAATAATQVKLLTLITGLVAALVLGGAALLLARRIAQRMDRCLGTARQVAAHDLRSTVAIDGSDEFAELGASLNAIVGSLRGALSEIKENAESVAAASEELTATSRQLSEGAGAVLAEALEADQNIDRVTTSMAETTEAADGLQASISEITTAVTEAAAVAAEAVRLAAATHDTIGRLGTSSTDVSTVVSLITDIAEQTNLLALNATIEAARAGEQGKGFAVVAGEVKELSRETATATEDIGSKVSAMQADTSRASEAIGRISDVIGRIDELQQQVARAVDTQTTATRQIADSVGVAGNSSAGVAGSVARLTQTSHLTHEAATQTEAAAVELARLSHGLRELSDRFEHQ